MFSCEVWEILENNYFQEHLNDCFCVLITSSYTDYAIKIIELMTRETVWKLKIFFTEMFHESVKKQFNWNLM